MATQNSEQRRLEDAFKIGEENAALILRLAPWCSHLKVELVSSGLYAQMSGLPIGMMAVRCAHASKGMQAMRLKEVAAFFIRENCQGCPHHEELNPNNAGRELLQAIDAVEEERSRPTAPQTEAKRRLHESLSGDLAQALEKAPTTEQSVLNLVALLEDEEHSGRAGNALVQAAEIAPELFSQLAWDVLSEYLSDLVLAGVCAKTIRVMGTKLGAIPATAVAASWRCVDKGLCHDEVLGLLGDDLGHGGELPIVPVVARALGHQAFAGRHFGGHRPSHPGLLHLIGEICNRDVDRVADACCRRLENRDPHVRAGTSVVLRKLLPVHPALGPPTLAALLDSLSLDDDEYEKSADVEACRALSVIYAQAPKATESKILNSFKRANEEVKELILQIFRRFGDLCRENSNEPAHATAVAAIPDALDQLLAFISSVDIPLKCRITAAETVRELASQHPKLVLSRCEAIFGMLALIFPEKIAFFQANPGGDPVLRGFPRSEWAYYDQLTSNLSRTLTEVGEHAAAPVFEALVGIIGCLDSKDKAQEELKVSLVEVYETLFQDYQIGIRMVPHLFNALMDMESVAVRFAALNCVAKILARKPELVPDNMKEILKLYLKDPYVAIHKGAARCMSAFKPASEEEAEEIALLLCIQFNVHRKRPYVESGHFGDLLDALIHICHGNSRLLRKYAFLAILALSRGDKSDLAERALSKFKRELSAVPDLATLYVTETLSYFQRFEFGGDEFYSDGKQLLLSLYDQPLAAITANQATFKQLIDKLIVDEEWYVAFQILAVLFHFELYQAAADSASDIENALPTDKSHEGAKRQARLFVAAARAEFHITARNSCEALATLDGVSTMLTTYGTPPESTDPRAFIEAFNVAHAAASRVE
jgi:hypothetical protein